MKGHPGNERLLWQHLKSVSIENVCKSCLKGVELKWQSFMILSCGGLELLRESFRGFGPVSGIDRVNKN